MRIRFRRSHGAFGQSFGNETTSFGRIPVLQQLPVPASSHHYSTIHAHEQERDLPAKQTSEKEK